MERSSLCYEAARNYRVLSAKPYVVELRTLQSWAVMVATSSERGTRSMSTSQMSDRMRRVVKSTSSAKTKVHMGSTTWYRVSSSRSKTSCRGWEGAGSQQGSSTLCACVCVHSRRRYRGLFRPPGAGPIQASRTSNEPSSQRRQFRIFLKERKEEGNQNPPSLRNMHYCQQSFCGPPCEAGATAGPISEV